MQLPPIDSVAALLSHAHRMEAEAVARYERLAAVMQASGRDEMATFFARMADIERRHVAQVDDMAEALELPDLPNQPAAWTDGSGPEAASPEIGEADGVKGAILEAMSGEEAAVQFFEAAGAGARDVTVRRLAEELAAEERHHVSLLRGWLQRLATPATRSPGGA